eukprot:Transcript_29592.p3 GENE.Transcript_29592~~Transcript_29592.p3  ORF type:complete len:179 (+),score=82.21 Transcript_29592:813-1349(+)
MYSLLSPSQLWHLSQSKHPPLFALARLRRTVEAVLEQRNSEGGRPSTGLELHLLSTTEAMLSAITGCERILRTPCPPGYVGVLRAVMLLWLAILPYSLLTIGWGVVPVISLAALLLLEVEEIAVQIENPFGLEVNDLPLDAYCLTVQADVLRLLDEEGCQVSLGLDAAGLEDGGEAPS